MGNTFSSRNTLKTKLLAAINAANTADQIVKLSRSIEKANLDDDADLETALDTKVSSLAGSAEPEDLEKLAFGVKKLRTPEGAGVPTSTMVAEGSSNLYVTQDRVRGSFSASGDLSYDSGTGVLSYTALPDALTVYATVADLPASGVAAGAKGIVEENKKLYVFTGASWVGVGLVDQKPSFNTNPDGSYTLTSGEDTVITLSATDPQGDPITYSYQVTAGSLGGSSVSQADNVFTVTGSTNPADTASFSITFSASDGTNVSTTTPSEFTVGFGVDWSSSTHSGTVINASAQDGSQAFGYSMASDDNYIVVGAYGHRDQGYYNRGLVSVYDHSGTLLYEIDNPMPMGSTGRGSGNLTYFAWDVAVGGGKIAVGARFLDNGGNSGDGAVFTFNASDGSWGHGKIAGHNNPNENRYMGSSVEVTSDGNYFIAGSPGQTNDVPVAGGSGMVSIHDTTTVPVSAIHCPNGDTQFGTSLALSDDNNTLFIGQSGYNSYRGIVWEYDITDKTSPTLTRSYDPAVVDGYDPNSYTQLASQIGSLKVKGSTLIVGGFYYTVGSETGAGSAFVYDTSTGNLVTRLMPPTSNEQDRFGWSVGISNDQQFFFVGSTQKYNDDNGNQMKGVVYVYDRSGTLVNTIENPTPSQYLPNEWSEAWGGSFGGSIEVTDTTIAIGAPDNIYSGNGTGKVYFFTE